MRSCLVISCCQKPFVCHIFIIELAAGAFEACLFRAQSNMYCVRTLTRTCLSVHRTAEQLCGRVIGIKFQPSYLLLPLTYFSFAIVYNIYILEISLIFRSSLQKRNLWIIVSMQWPSRFRDIMAVFTVNCLFLVPSFLPSVLRLSSFYPFFWAGTTVSSSRLHQLVVVYVFVDYGSAD